MLSLKVINKTKVFNIKGYNLSITTQWLKWGSYSGITDDLLIRINKLGSTNVTYEIEPLANNTKHNVNVLVNNKSIIQFTDLFGKNYESFTRIFKNKTHVFEDGVLILTKITSKLNFFSKKAVDKKISNRFITLDIETRTLKGKISPFCISYYDGVKSYSFYLTDFNNPEEMLLTCILSLLKRKI